MKIFLFIAIALIYLIAILWLINFTIKTKQKIIKNSEQFKETLYKKYQEEAKQEYTSQRELYLNELKDLSAEIAEKQNFNTSLLKMREDELDRLMEVKRTAANEAFAKEIDDTTRQIQEWTVSAQEAMNFQISEKKQELNKEIQAKNNELNIIKEEIEDYRAKQNIINEAILRAREVEEKSDFYKIQLDKNSIRDISILNKIRNELSKIDILDKIIYDNYIKKPVDEMIKRVLNGKAPCGIYKITRLNTGEIYIGKSTDIKTRWQQHCKSAYHCGTISHSILHTTMEKDGLWNFTFELLEEVEKDKLTEREKYWIKFYDSKTYGLNEREG